MTIRVPVGPTAETAVQAAFAEIARLQALLSAHASDSALCRLNASAWDAPHPAAGALARVLRAALALARASDGAFDPCIGGRLIASGQRPGTGGRIPDPRATWRDIRLRQGHVRFLRPLSLDFGGIAKGYAVDRAIQVLRAHRQPVACVNAGGDLRLAGMEDTICVRDPRRPTHALPVARIRDLAVATSAGTFAARAGDGELFDPRSGRVLARNASATVVAPRAIWADALTKVALASPSTAATLLRRLGAEGLLIDGLGRRRYLR